MSTALILGSCRQETDGIKPVTRSWTGSNILIKGTQPVPQCRGAPGTFWVPWTGQARPSDWTSGRSERSARLFQPELWRDPARWPSGLVQTLTDLVSGQSKAPWLGAQDPKSAGRKGREINALNPDLNSRSAWLADGRVAFIFRKAASLQLRASLLELFSGCRLLTLS